MADRPRTETQDGRGRCRTSDPGLVAMPDPADEHQGAGAGPGPLLSPAWPTGQGETVARISGSRSYAPRRNAVLAAPRPHSPRETTRSVAEGIPTRSVGTSFGRRGQPRPLTE